jgi:hypothetical protein
MLRNESVDLVIHAGDLDYESAPHTWDNFLTANLGGMDLFAVKGNHDSNCDEGPGDAMGCALPLCPEPPSSKPPLSSHGPHIKHPPHVPCLRAHERGQNAPRKS